MTTANNNLLSILEHYRKIAIIVKGSPDPDAIASAFAIQTLAAMQGSAADIISTARISLERNVQFVKMAGIKLMEKQKLPSAKNYNAYIVVDHQSPEVQGYTGTLPCAAHIDHHEEIEHDIPVDFRLVDTSAGSTCTMLTLLIQEMNINPEELTTELFTSLLYGINTDTDKYEHASKKDYEAISFLTPRIDHQVFNQISGTVLTGDMLQHLNNAIKNQEIYRDWLITGLKYLDHMKRDTIAIVADYLLKREKVDAVIVFAIIVDEETGSFSIDSSIRARKKSTNLNEMIKSITSNGGGRKFKGAFQVDLDYFHECPDREALWKVVEITTLQVLKNRRDTVYISDMKGLYKNFSRRVRDLFDFKKPG